MKIEAQISVNPVRHAVSADDVTFTYHGADRPALRAVSFAQAAGEMIGVIQGLILREEFFSEGQIDAL